MPDFLWSAKRSFVLPKCVFSNHLQYIKDNTYETNETQFERNHRKEHVRMYKAKLIFESISLILTCLIILRSADVQKTHQTGRTVSGCIQFNYNESQATCIFKFKMYFTIQNVCSYRWLSNRNGFTQYNTIQCIH